jgi:imidazolonepropionase-like amidohydrolase
VMGANKGHGVLAAGRLADMVPLEGDSTQKAFTNRA